MSSGFCFGEKCGHWAADSEGAPASHTETSFTFLSFPFLSSTIHYFSGTHSLPSIVYYHLEAESDIKQTFLALLLLLQLHFTQWRHRSRARVSNTADLFTATVCQSQSTFSSVPLGSDCTMISQGECQYDSWITVPLVIPKSMQMSQNRNCSRKLFLIFGQLFSLLHYPVGRKFVWLCFL